MFNGQTYKNMILCKYFVMPEVQLCICSPLQLLEAPDLPFSLLFFCFCWNFFSHVQQSHGSRVFRRLSFSLCPSSSPQGQQLHQRLPAAGRRSHGHPPAGGGAVSRRVVRTFSQPAAPHRYRMSVLLVLRLLPPLTGSLGSGEKRLEVCRSLSIFFLFIYLFITYFSLVRSYLIF